MKIAGLLAVALVHLGMGQEMRLDPGRILETPVSVQSALQSPNGKSPLLATLLSLVLPGAGEYYAGNETAAGYFFAADGALWLAFAGLSLQSDWVMDDARLFARERAGVDFAGKDARFEAQVGNYPSRDLYNESRLRERRYDEIYAGPSFGWSWSGPEDRMRYRALRIRSDELAQVAEFAVGALVVNRIISAFSAWRSARSHNSTWRVGAGVQRILDAPGVGLHLSRSF